MRLALWALPFSFFAFLNVFTSARWIVCLHPYKVDTGEWERFRFHKISTLNFFSMENIGGIAQSMPIRLFAMCEKVFLLSTFESSTFYNIAQLQIFTSYTDVWCSYVTSSINKISIEIECFHLPFD